eukprot:sb/3476609/
MLKPDILYRADSKPRIAHNSFDVPDVSDGANDTVIRTPLRLTSGSMMGSYGMMMDATAMCVMGFGFLYAFCKKYTWAGITFNLFICGLCFLWCQVYRLYLIWASRDHVYIGNTGP